MTQRTFDPVEKGTTSFFACRADPRFSYCLYVPKGFSEHETDRRRLIVVLHGSLRNAESYRNDYVAFGEETNTVILAPLFPSGVVDYNDIHNYKFIRFHGIRFDHLLLAMVDEVAEKYRLDAERFLIHGFSGGGQFLHRFFYLHPKRLRGVSIGAPGMVTLINPGKDWWVGTRNFENTFGSSIDLEAIRSVPVQLVIGAEDTETSGITIKPDWNYWWMEGANDAGRTRIDRLGALRDNYEQYGISVRFDLVPGVGHAGFQVQPRVRDFFRGLLR